MVRRKESPTKSSTSKKSTQYVAVFDSGKREVSYMDKRMYNKIRNLQLSTNFLIPKLPFARLVREIMMDIIPYADEFRIQSKALQALQESCELYMTNFFEDSYLCTLHANRQTLKVVDMQLCRRIRGRQDIINH